MKQTEKNFLQMPNSFWLNTAKKMEMAEKIIFIYLASMCYGDKLICYPSQERISDETGLSLRTVRDKIKSLSKKGFIQIGHAENIAKNVDGRQLSYTLVHWDRLANVDIEANSAGNKQPAKNVKTTGKKCQNNRQNLPTKNTNRIIQMNKNLAAEAAEISSTTRTTDTLETREEQLDTTDEFDTITEEEARLLDEPVDTNEPESKETDDTNKPVDVSCYYHPNASLEEIKIKILNFFKALDPVGVWKHKSKLTSLTDEQLPLLINGYKYLPDYWKDFQYGNGSLTMFIMNIQSFIDTVESDRWAKQMVWEDDNNQYLVQKTIVENDIFDNKKELVKHIKANPTVRPELTDIQQEWLTTKKENLFFMDGCLKVNKWGTAFRPEHFKQISNKTIKALYHMEDK